MGNSIFLAKLIGLTFTIIGVAILANREWYRELIDQFFGDRGQVYVSGALALLAGIAIILVHNVWTTNWRVLITLIGWIAAIRGAARLIFPQLAMRWATKMTSTTTPTTFAGFGVLVVGLFLTAMGYLN